MTETTNVKTRIAGQYHVIPTRIRELIHRRRKSKKKYQRSLDPDEKRRLNRLNRDVERELDDFHSDRWRQRLDDLTTEDNSLFKMARVLIRKKTEVPPIHGRNGIAYSIEEKTEAFADQIEEQFRPNEDFDLDDEWEEEVLASVNSLLQENKESLEPLRATSPKEILKTVRILKNRRAPSSDGILNMALKNLPNRELAMMANITNAIMRLCHFPRRWKNADIVMISKQGKDLRFPQSYRPISLLPTMGKTVESVIKNRLGRHIEDLNILPENQFAFRKGLGTEL